ncbi:sensor histidine kinase [Ramlibacter sp. Leaf400]|uniref:sensor histidine kinase n=1 Tax=Ramlibacter sp. Leaf400 TaxID=1736365 RepID=UPI003FA6E284
MGDVVTRSIETVRPLIEARRHELVLQHPPERLVVDGDATRLAQVLQNLLVNAAKYTPEGGEIHVSTRRVGRDVEVAVQDSGRGIEPQELEHIFELFTQVEGAQPATADSGLGVGLALARALVHMHGGSIRAQSEGTGRGATFRFRLPLAHQASA